jgi:hypothetical protein
LKNLKGFPLWKFSQFAANWTTSWCHRAKLGKDDSKPKG